MTYRLLIDTTHHTMMLALTNHNELVEYIESHQESHRYHSSVLLPTLQRMLSQHNLTPADLTDIGVNTGPGSFTGIRTGLITARLFAQFLPLTTHSFNSFELIAGELQFRNQPITILLDAFRNRHYRASLTVHDSGEREWHQHAEIILNDNAVQPTQTDHCIVSHSLMDKLPDTINGTSLEELSLNSPAVMHFLLSQASQDFIVPWQELLPLYLQDPHITVKKPVEH